MPFKFESPIYVTKPAFPDFNNYCDLLKGVWERGILTNGGPVEQQFRSKLESLFASNVSLFSNGHGAIEAALRALGVEGEVITTPFTFPSTTHALLLNNIKPIFCDVAKDQPNLDVEQLPNLITSKTSAILAVHVYGYPCDIERLENIAKEYSLKLIYDASHAFGVKYKGKALVSYGDVSTLSFHATKLFNSAEGGATIFNDEALRPMMESVKDFGFDRSNGDNVLISGNLKMSELHAAMGVAGFDQVEANIEKRKKLVSIYRSELAGCEHIKLIDLPSSEVEWNYAYMPVRVSPVSGSAASFRDRLVEFMNGYNVFPRKYFYPICTELESYREMPFFQQELPNAMALSESVICLPLYPLLTETEVLNVCEIIKKFSFEG